MLSLLVQEKMSCLVAIVARIGTTSASIEAHFELASEQTFRLVEQSIILKPHNACTSNLLLLLVI